MCCYWKSCLAEDLESRTDNDSSLLMQILSYVEAKKELLIFTVTSASMMKKLCSMILNYVEWYREVLWEDRLNGTIAFCLSFIVIGSQMNVTLPSFCNCPRNWEHAIDVPVWVSWRARFVFIPAAREEYGTEWSNFNPLRVQWDRQLEFRSFCKWKLSEKLTNHRAIISQLH